MNKEYLQEKIALFYSRLSPDLQEIFSSMKWLENLKSISIKYAFTDQQTESLSTETMLVMLGIIHLDEYEAALQSELSLPKETFDKLLSEINTSVLSAIRPELAATYDRNYEDSTAEVIEPDLDERFEKLPAETQKIIAESNYQNTLYLIGKEYQFNVQQLGELEKATTNLIAGSTRPEKFGDALEQSLNLQPETTARLVSDINQKILKDIREKTMAKGGTNSSVEKNHEDIMSAAGIEILDDEKPEQVKLPALDKLELPAGKVEGTVPREEKKIESASILAQKIVSSFKTQNIKTEYSLNNLSKPKSETDKPTPEQKPAPTAYPPKGDPYRLSPDE